ncbi:hypothetical protein R70723_29095 [Paenibacillus sp. FSL R7-0273]|uniref:MarR family transcriptional regulator n=1 Tax=Paenibacillus sp. FSL R7-0273 TaxID=1536772 RepID=UPI0004F6B5D1|nr:MarR family transcriptional regulator [Paenibacillus sp. FSL R7-0273]AIQ49489.1 hypothetical protein R70723_29095 [Paenibacillus sp. FSL R7-0273]OMF89689.1 hypothetical protein BK144_19205 [Paenibacillus sp. FSL R7-0273]
MYNEWGFKRSPFDTNPLPANNEGKELLIGRQNDLNKIKRRLASSSNIITVEGNNGIGKTSLANITAYAMYNDYLESGEGVFLVPCSEPIQMTSDKDSEEFIDEVLIKVFQTLLTKGHELAESGYRSSSKNINIWLSQVEPMEQYFKDMKISIIGSARVDFRIKILNWLKEIFPYNTNGGVVCILDNLELLNTCDDARKKIEEFRDTLFGYTGIRWILSGALGIVYGLMSSPRLEGRLSPPIELYGIDKKFSSEILQSRVKKYAQSEDIYLPLNIDEFSHLFELLKENTRHTLSYCDDYCIWISDYSHNPQTYEEKKQMYFTWLEVKSKKKVESLRKNITPTTLKTFISAAEMGGEFTLSDYESFGFKSINSMRPYINNLEQYNLVMRSTDENDKRRKTIQLTPEGWIYNFGLSLLQQT